MLLARAAWIASPRQYRSHEPFGVLRGGRKHPAFHRGAYERLERVSGAQHVGNVLEPGPIVRIAHDDAILRIAHHETFRDRFQCISELASGAVKLLSQALFGRDIAGGS
jgi:hypothetical protein